MPETMEEQFFALVHQAGEAARSRREAALETHRERIRQVVEEAASRCAPRPQRGELKAQLTVVAGPNGSGKTTLATKFLRHPWFSGCTYVNPDLIAQQEFGGWNAPEAVRKAATRAEEIRETCLAVQASLTFETVFSTEGKLDFLRRAKEAGYLIRFIFVCTDDPSINAQRVARRVMEGGHEVPLPKIISRYYRALGLAVRALPWADQALFFDNTPTDADPRLIFRMEEGKVTEREPELPSWAREVVGAVRAGA